jgi:hypothetical protein
MIGNKEKKTGGPAFPGEFVQFESGEIGNNVAIKAQGEGMSLRDYFAGQALAVMCASNVSATGTFAWASGRETVASVCYQMADAMLVDRAK